MSHDYPTSADAATAEIVTGGLNEAEPASRTATSPYDSLHLLQEHAHSAVLCYPTLADGVVVTGGAAWTLGAFAEIVPASTIADDFDIHGLSIEAMSAVDVYEVHLFYGDSDTFAGRVRVVRTTNQDSAQFVTFMTDVIPANSKIRAKIASSTGGDTVTVSIRYHSY